MVVAQAKLALGAVHAIGLHAAELGLLDLHAAGEHGADHGGHDVVALVEVLGTAHNLERHGVAVLVDVLVANGDLAEPHVVRVRVRLLAHHLGGVDVVEVRANTLDALDLGAGADVLLDQVIWVVGQVHHVLEPLIRNAHGICVPFWAGLELPPWFFSSCRGLLARAPSLPCPGLELVQEAHVAGHEHAQIG